MQIQYNYDIKIQHNNGATIEIDSKELYGYFEFPDGTEGGGLWFSPDGKGMFELADYDGVATLKTYFLNMLHSAGVYIEGKYFYEDESDRKTLEDCTITVKPSYLQGLLQHR